MRTSTALLAVAIVALVSQATAQTCLGVNVTTSPLSAGGSYGCPYGYYFDKAYLRCLLYSDIVANYLNTPCSLDIDCGPNIMTFQGQVLFKCGYQSGKCTWANTRMINDTCEVNTNCYQSVPGSVGITLGVGCNQSNKTCNPVVRSPTAQLGDKCNYYNYDQYITCSDVTMYCKTTSYLRQLPADTSIQTLSVQTCATALDFAANCTAFGSPNYVPCRADAICFVAPFTLRSYCSPLRQPGESCRTGSDCLGGGVTTYCSANTCQKYIPIGGDCSGNASRCYTDLTGNTYSSVCQSNVCIQTGGYQQSSPCATGVNLNLYPINNTCYQGFVGDLCSNIGDDKCAQFGNVCSAGVCIARLPLGSNCTGIQAGMCQFGLQCYNNTCITLQQEGQQCDTTGLVNYNNYLYCNTTLVCSRYKCILPNTLPTGTLCENDGDCYTSFCDTTLKRCTRKIPCGSAATCGANSQCICSAGNGNLGTCFNPSLCSSVYNSLTACMTASGVSLTYFSNGLTAAADIFLDQDSNLYKNCSQKHQDYVSCQATLAKTAAPSVGSVPIRGYSYRNDLGNSALTLKSGMWSIVLVAIVSLLILN